MPAPVVGAATMTVLQAINAALSYEMAHDQTVVILGEDVGRQGGIFRTTQGLQDKFGEERVIDAPLDEKGIVGHAIGMALYGLRPVVEIQFSGFIHDAFEQIMFCGSKYRWLTGGQYSCPMVIRAPSYGGIKGGFWHSQSPEAYFVHGGGIKIVAPSTPADAYGLTLAAIRDPDPVLVIEPVPLYRALSGPVTDDGVAVPIGRGSVALEGDELTVLTYGPMRQLAVHVAESMSSEGHRVEVIDLRTLIPFDLELILASVRKTGRVVIVHEAARSLGFGSELVTVIQEKAIEILKAPIARVTGHDVPYSFSIGDEYFRPNATRVRAAIERTLEYEY